MENDNKNNPQKTKTKHQTHMRKIFLPRYQGNFSFYSLLEVSGVKGLLLLLWSGRSLGTVFTLLVKN